MFRIKSLTILNHYVLGYLHLDFWRGSEESTEDIYSTVVIGVNGIGKSHLLRAIADIFCYLEALKSNYADKKNAPRFKFKIDYYLNDYLYEFANIKDIEPVSRNIVEYSQVSCQKNGAFVLLQDMQLPERIIASTMTVTDKFNTVWTSRYRYKGIRNENSPSTTGTRTMIRKTVSGLLHSLDVKEGFRDEVKLLLDALGLESMMEVTYMLRYRDVFMKKDMSIDKMNEIFSNQGKYFNSRNTALWGTRNYEKMKNDHHKMEVATDYLRKCAEKYGEGAKKVVINYHVLENEDFVKDREAIEVLSAIDILSFPSLVVFKKNRHFEFSESSSGETHILCQMLGIMSDIEHGSLVMIDEPENSAHPNWQINYIGWLKKIFKSYSDCHFVIATHSHFLLTDMQPESSDIIALERSESGEIHDIAESLNTFCWSVDDILYKVFHVRNTRNRVFEEKVADLYDRISKRDNNLEAIKLLINELSRYQLNEGDPLRKLILKAKDYVES